MLTIFSFDIAWFQKHLHAKLSYFSSVLSLLWGWQGCQLWNANTSPSALASLAKVKNTFTVQFLAGWKGQEMGTETRALAPHGSQLGRSRLHNPTGLLWPLTLSSYFVYIWGVVLIEYCSYWQRYLQAFCT